MIEQFVGKTFNRTLTALLALFFFSAIAYFFNLGFPIMVLISVGAFAVTVYKVELGMFIVFAELFSNPHGHLMATEIFGQNISLRIALFGAVMTGWLIALIVKRTKWRFDYRALIFFPIFLGVFLGVTKGVEYNSITDVFADANAYAYLLYIFPIMSLDITSETQKRFLQILAAASVWLIAISVLLFFMFTHFSEDILTITYTFVRDIRLAEITNLSEQVYRIFIQSQFFVFSLLALFLALDIFSEKRPGKKILFVYALLSTSILIGMSRSFWVGFAFAMVLFMLFIYKFSQSPKKAVAQSLHRGIVGLLGALVLLTTVSLIPVGISGASFEGLSGALKDRTTTQDAAVSSRWKLLEPMKAAIVSSPILGSGFGTTVSFDTDDPRAVELRGEGVWTTYAMEWGWLELWLKMGILGPFGFLFAGYMIVRNLWCYTWTEQKWLSIGLISSITFLFVTHVFSPYLNHPIGLGFLLFCVIFLPNKKTTKEAVLEMPKLTFSKKMETQAALSSKTN